MSEDYNTKKIVVRSFLRDISLKYRNEEAGYVSDLIFPVISGLNKEAKVYRHARADWFRVEAGTRAPGGAAPVAETRADAVNLDPQNYAIAKKIPDELRQQANAPGNFPLQPDIDAAQYISDQIWMKREQKTSDLIYATDWNGNGVGGLDATGNWGDPTEASDTMVIDLADGETQIVSNTGKRPTDLFLSFPAWQKIKVSPFWLNKLNHTKFAGNITPDAIAQTLNYNIHIGWAVENLAVESTDIDDMTSRFIMAPITDNAKGHAFLYYRPSSPGIDTLSAGYQYRLRKDGSSDIKMSRWREDALHSDMMDGEMEFDISAMCEFCGVQWKDTATT